MLGPTLLQISLWGGSPPCYAHTAMETRLYLLSRVMMWATGPRGACGAGGSVFKTLLLQLHCQMGLCVGNEVTLWKSTLEILCNKILL